MLKHYDKLSNDFQVIHKKINSNNTMKNLKPFFNIKFLNNFFFIYKISKKSSTKYYKKSKERFQT